MYCNHHFHFPLALFHVSKLKLRELTPNSPFPPPPISWQLLLYPPFLWPRPFLALYINGLMCFSFCVSLSIMTSRFIQGMCQNYIPFQGWIAHFLQFICSSINGLLDFFLPFGYCEACCYQWAQASCFQRQLIHYMSVLRLINQLPILDASIAFKFLLL